MYTIEGIKQGENKVEMTRCFNRSKLKRIVFGKDTNDIWYLKTVYLDKDSLKITIVKSAITEDTMQVIVKLYIDVDVNSTLELVMDQPRRN